MDKEFLRDKLYEYIIDLEYAYCGLDYIAQEFIDESYWIKKDTGEEYWYECENCGGKPLKDMYGNTEFTPFCPYCGAMMEIEVQENE